MVDSTLGVGLKIGCANERKREKEREIATLSETSCMKYFSETFGGRFVRVVEFLAE